MTRAAVAKALRELAILWRPPDKNKSACPEEGSGPIKAVRLASRPEQYKPTSKVRQ
jgi:hypothetical protein